MQDIRYAFRNFYRAPLFALTVVGTIGLALGLNTTLFTIFNAYVMRPFAVHDPYSLYRFTWNSKSEKPHGLTLTDFDRFQAQNVAFVETLGFSLFMTRGEGYQFMGEQVSDNYFQLLSPKIEMGRALLPGDENVLLLSDAAWRGKFGGAPDILGRKLNIIGNSYQVIGVAAPEFGGLSQTVVDIWVPLIRSGQQAAVGVSIVGRLKPGESPKQCEFALMSWAREVTADQPDSKRAVGVVLESAATSIHFTPEMLAMFAPVLAAFGLVLGIACANVANMMLARGLARQREIGVRLSLGAARFRLIRQLLTESLLLALPAALAGLFVSQVAIRFAERLIMATAPPIWLEIIHFFKMETDFHVFFFILGAAVVSTLLFGLAPAIQATRPGISYAARGDFSADIRPSRLRNALVVSQVTLSALLLICSGVLLRAGRKMEMSDVVLSPHNVFDLRFLKGKIDPKLVDGLMREPGVQTVATVWRAPLFGFSRGLPVAAGHDATFVSVGYNFVSPEYFDAMHIPILRGRNFTAEESLSEAAVAIVSEKTAARFWPGEDAMGKAMRINLDSRAAPWMKYPGFSRALVVGVARDVMSAGPNGPNLPLFPDWASGRQERVVSSARDQ